MGGATLNVDLLPCLTKQVYATGEEQELEEDGVGGGGGSGCETIKRSEVPRKSLISFALSSLVNFLSLDVLLLPNSFPIKRSRRREPSVGASFSIVFLELAGYNNIYALGNHQPVLLPAFFELARKLNKLEGQGRDQWRRQLKEPTRSMGASVVLRSRVRRKRRQK